MEYKQNVHVLLHAEKFENLRRLGNRLNISRSELIRRAVDDLLFRDYKKQGVDKGVVQND